MGNSDRMGPEAEAIQAIKTSNGLNAIMSEIQRRINLQHAAIDLDDPQWALKMADRNGRLLALREIRDWVKGRLILQPKRVPPTEA